MGTHNILLTPKLAKPIKTNRKTASLKIDIVKASLGANKIVQLKIEY
jgi:hypothetical protein